MMASPTSAIKSRVLGFDESCGSKRYTFFFTDTSHTKQTDDDRRVWIREMDGTLRTGDQDERDRANATFKAKLHHPLRLPGLFQRAGAMSAALDAHQHPHILDSICKIRPRDSRPYVQTHVDVYRHVHLTGLYSLLQDSPHFYGFLRWVLLFNESKLPAIDTDQ
jgi:hypothetical protein